MTAGVTPSFLKMLKNKNKPENYYYHIKAKNNETNTVYCIRLFVKEEDLERLKKFYKNSLDKNEEFLIVKV